MICAVWRVACGVRRAACGVRRAACGVWCGGRDLAEAARDDEGERLRLGRRDRHPLDRDLVRARSHLLVALNIDLRTRCTHT